MQNITLELQLTSEKRNSILLNEGIGKSQHWPSSVASVSYKLSPGHHCQVTCMLSAMRGAMLVTLNRLMQQAAMGRRVSPLDVMITDLKHNRKTLKNDPALAVEHVRVDSLCEQQSPAVRTARQDKTRQDKTRQDKTRRLHHSSQPG